MLWYDEHTRERVSIFRCKYGIKLLKKHYQYYTSINLTLQSINVTYYKETVYSFHYGVKMLFPNNAHHSQEIQDFVNRLAFMAEVKEFDNRSHLARIRGYCRVLARGCNIPKTESEIIAIASQLHDVGKYAMPETLLNRKGDFLDSEWPAIERHTTDGAAFLKDSPSLVLQTAAVIAEYHHERFDGSGYPNKRFDFEIPLAAKICAVADVFDALTTPRSYKEIMEVDEARRLLTDSGGKLFDPKVIDAFNQNFAEILKIKQSFNY